MNAIKKHPWRAAAIVCAVVLAVLLICLLWPRSWNSIAGEGEISTFQATLWETVIREEEGHEAHVHRSVELSAGAVGVPQGGEEILELLSSARFHARPWDSLVLRLTGGYSTSGGSSARLIVVHDETDYSIFTLYRSGVMVGDRAVYSLDEELYDAIADLIRQYGEAEERVRE